MPVTSLAHRGFATNCLFAAAFVALFGTSCTEVDGIARLEQLSPIDGGIVQIKSLKRDGLDWLGRNDPIVLKKGEQYRFEGEMAAGTWDFRNVEETWQMSAPEAIELSKQGKLPKQVSLADPNGRKVRLFSSLHESSKIGTNEGITNGYIVFRYTEAGQAGEFRLGGIAPKDPGKYVLQFVVAIAAEEEASSAKKLSLHSSICLAKNVVVE